MPADFGKQSTLPPRKTSYARWGGPSDEDKARKQAQFDRGQRLQDARSQRQIATEDIGFAKQQAEALKGPGTTPGGAGPAVQPPTVGLPKLPVIDDEKGGGGPRTGGEDTFTLNADLYKPLKDLEAESKQYREDLKNNTGRIAGQVAGATGDFLNELYNQSGADAAMRGVGGSGVESQMRQQARDTAARAGAKQLGDVQLGQQQQLGGAIQGALGITSATPELSLKERGLGLESTRERNAASQRNFQNKLALQNQGFQQYLALLNAQRQSPVYSGFNF